MSLPGDGFWCEYVIIIMFEFIQSLVISQPKH